MLIEDLLFELDDVINSIQRIADMTDESLKDNYRLFKDGDCTQVYDDLQSFNFMQRTIGEHLKITQDRFQKLVDEYYSDNKSEDDDTEI